MSHTYFITEDNTSTGKQLALVGLSNSSHEDWMERAGLMRDMRNLETGEVQSWPYSTTIHDKEPLFVYSYEFMGYVDAAQDSYGADSPEHMKMLYDFCATVEALEVEQGKTFQVWLY